jgi:hypothetical protein
LAPSKLRSLIIARGSLQLAAEVQALGRLTEKAAAETLTPYALVGSSAAATKQGRKASHQPAKAAELSVQEASELLLQQLVQSNSKLTQQQVVDALCSARSPDDQSCTYQHVLCTSLAGELMAMSLTSTAADRRSLWMAAAVLQQQLHAAAGGDSKLAAVLMGPMLTEEAYIR